MTAFGGALTDPTKIMASRIGAYIVDAILATVVVLGLFYVFQLSNYESFKLASSSAASEFCQTSNASAERLAETLRRADPTNPTEVRQTQFCFNIGNRAYVLTDDQVDGATPVFMLYSGIFTAFNWVLLPAITGASLGKHLFGLRIVTNLGTRAGIGRNLVRWIVGIVDFACCGLPAYLVASNSAGHRRLGDMAAGTYVVHRSAAGRILNIPGHQVVRRRQDPALTSTEPVATPATPLPDGAGIAAPLWDEARNTYIRYDQDSGVWFMWDEAAHKWVPAET